MNTKQRTQTHTRNRDTNKIHYIKNTFLSVGCFFSIFPGVFGAFFCFEDFVLCSSQVTSTCNQLICSCTLAEAEKTGESNWLFLVLFWGGGEIPNPFFGGDEILRWKGSLLGFFCWANLEQEGVCKYTFGWINLQRISKMFCPNKEMRNDPVPFISTNLFMFHEDSLGGFCPWFRFFGAWNYDLSWFQYNSRVFRDAATNTPKHCGQLVVFDFSSQLGGRVGKFTQKKSWTLESSNSKITQLEDNNPKNTYKVLTTKKTTIRKWLDIWLFQVLGCSFCQI